MVVISSTSDDFQLPCRKVDINNLVESASVERLIGGGQFKLNLEVKTHRAK